MQTYRAEIDGLRAVAVLSVILYHFYPNFIPGGYFGVDIFFVISGFLITNIINDGIKTSTFSIYKFYDKRIRRIFPTLILILLTSMFIGNILLYKDELRELNGHVFSSTLFISNFTYFDEINYFARDSIEKPLLHLWSLAIEEQFYIFFPLFLVLIKKLRFNLILCIIIATIASMSFFIYFQDAQKAFYMPYSRWWEILIGSIVSIKYHNNGHKPFQNIITASLIVIIFFSLFKPFDFNKIFNSQVVIIFSTALIILFSNELSGMSKVLTSRLMVYIGKISYPLYLWHWPVISFMAIVNTDLYYYEKLISLIFVFFISHYTYTYFENKIRYSKKSFTSPLLLIILFIIGATSFYGTKEIGNNRHIDKNKIVEYQNPEWTYPRPLNNDCGISSEEISKQIAHCKKDSRGNTKYALIGDSKAQSLIPGLYETSTDQGRWLAIVGNNGHGAPAPYISDHGAWAKNQPLIKSAVEAVSENTKIKAVVLTSALRTMAVNKKVNGRTWSKALEVDYTNGKEGMENVVRKLLKNNKKIIIMIDHPPLGYYKDCNARNIHIPFIGDFSIGGRYSGCEISKEEYKHLRSKYLKALNEIKSISPSNIYLFDLTEIIFDKNYMFKRVDEKGYASLSYGDHISGFLAVKIAHQLNSFLNEIID